MPLATLIIGIVVMLMVMRTPPDKPLMTKPAKIGFWILISTVGIFVAWLTVQSPETAPKMIGRVAAYVFLIGLFVVIGEKLRKGKTKKDVPPAQ